MKWIVVAILVVIVPYTFLRWHYRKPGRAFEPYHDMKDRANTLRLLSAGFQRITLEASRPLESSSLAGVATVQPATGGLPDSLAATLVDRPLLPAEIVNVHVGAAASTLMSYPIEFTCTAPDNRQQLGGAQLYLRGGEVIVIPHFERLTGGLLTRTRDSFIRVTVPAGALKPGHYRAVLVGARSSRSWQFDVR
jgi:hypothetical protein